MHEFTLACNVLEIVEENVKRQNAGKVTELTLEIGSMAGVELSALQIALESLKENSILENTFIKYDIIQAKAICSHCQCNFEPAESYSPCPNCQQYGIQINSGKEIIVKSMVIE